MQNIDVSGRSTILGGEYGQISVSGSCTAQGDITCVRIDSSGSFRALGNIVCSEDIDSSGAFNAERDVQSRSIDSSGSVHVGGSLCVSREVDSSGMLDIKGNADIGEADASGAFKVHGDLKAKELDASGMLKVDGNLSATDFESSGKLYVGGDCEAESAELSGMFEIRGLLSADNLDIALYGSLTATAGSVGGGSVHVHSELNGIYRIFGKKGHEKPLFVTSTIEADTIDIHCTKAESIRGCDIIIGAGCDIGRVEYTGTLKIEEGATVREHIKL